jgi:hypothetical protein
MNKPELEAAIGTLDTLIQVFALLVAIGIVGEVGFGVRHWVLARRLQVIQSAEDLSQEQAIAGFNKEAGDARKDAALAIERAAKAEENLGAARKEAAAASERAAEANRIAEGEKLARLKIEEKLAPRNLTEEQQKRFKDKVGLFVGTPYELVVDPVPEAINLITTIDNILRSSSWFNKESERKDLRSTFTLPSGSKVEQAYFSGVVVQLTNALRPKYFKAAEMLVVALRGEGIDAVLSFLPANDPSPNTIHVAIGIK